METTHRDVNTTSQQTRREFCIDACRAGTLLALSATLGSLLSSCKGDDATGGDAPALPILQATIAGVTVTVSNISSSPLASVGGAALVQYSGGSLLVAQTSQGVFVAATSVCTHQQCTITGFKEQVYVCPCHGSRFHTNGQVAQGPASSPLRTFPTQFSNDQLTITL
jgi:cytochrome b6-f complex iron-sulfur subunit